MPWKETCVLDEKMAFIGATALKAAAALNCGRSLRLSLLLGDREFESPILQW